MCAVAIPLAIVPITAPYIASQSSTFIMK
jgi:hypothetical protein